MTRHARKNRQAGFTLFEVLAAMSLFAIASLGMTQFAVQSIRHTADNRASTGAVILAQQEIAKTKVKDLPAGSRMEPWGTCTIYGSYGMKLIDGPDTGKTGYVDQTLLKQES